MSPTALGITLSPPRTSPRTGTDTDRHGQKDPAKTHTPAKICLQDVLRLCQRHRPSSSSSLPLDGLAFYCWCCERIKHARKYSSNSESSFFSLSFGSIAASPAAREPVENRGERSRETGSETKREKKSTWQPALQAWLARLVQ